MVAAPRRPWFPDFCRLSRIAAILGIAELVVVVIAIAPTHAPRWSAHEFAVTSAFALWLALTQAVIYCKSRPLIEPLPRWLGVALALAVPLLVALFGAWAVQQIDLGLSTDYRSPPLERWGNIASIAALSVLISALSLRYFYVTEQWQAQVNAHAKAEVDALQARIRPHFLFNSINTIASLVRRDPETAERVLEDLSELFRAALGAGQGESTLAEEIHLAERYLEIEALRLGDRLQVDWQVAADVPKDLRLPRLVLQPLLENAVTHGIARLPHGGEIFIGISRQAKQLRFVLRNPVLPARARDGGNNHAQDSIAQRLAYHFGATARMSTGFADGDYVCEIELPLP